MANPARGMSENHTTKLVRWNCSESVHGGAFSKSQIRVLEYWPFIRKPLVTCEVKVYIGPKKNFTQALECFTLFLSSFEFEGSG